MLAGLGQHMTCPPVTDDKELGCMKCWLRSIPGTSLMTARFGFCVQGEALWHPDKREDVLVSGSGEAFWLSHFVQSSLAGSQIRLRFLALFPKVHLVEIIQLE